MSEWVADGGSLGSIAGRDAELAVLDAFVGRHREKRLLVLEGEAGIGKTTLWRWAVQRAEMRGVRLLSASPTVPESMLSFSALGDLLAPVLPDTLAVLPPPQRRALEAALLLADVQERGPHEPRAIGLAFLGIVREVAQGTGAVVAIDDIQWLDAASAAAVEFACRRLRDDPVGLLVTRRSSERSTLTSIMQWFAPEHSELVELGPLTIGAVGHLLRRRTSVPLSRPTLRRAFELSGGNPLFALGIAASLERGPARVPTGGPPPLPASLHDVVSSQLGELDERARAVALAAAALAEPRIDTLLDTLGAGAREGLATAVDRGVLTTESGLVRFVHPLLASVVYAEASREELRRLHNQLAETVTDPEERARHLAAVAVGPDARVAAAVEEAADLARTRGALQKAAELAEEAVILTPASDAETICRRLTRAGEYAFATGETDRALVSLDRAIAVTSPSAARAEALLASGFVLYDAAAEKTLARTRCEQAMLEAAGDPLLEARALVALAGPGCRNYRESVRDALRALDLLSRTTRSDPRIEASALTELAWASYVAGYGVDEQWLERADALEREGPQDRVASRARTTLGTILAAIGRPDEALRLLEEAHQTANNEGDESSLPDITWWMAWVHLIGGDWRAASDWAAQTAEAASLARQGAWESAAAGIVGMIAARRGQVELARQAAAAVDPGDFIPHDLQVLSLLELSLGELESAERHLSALETQATELGVGEPVFLRYEADRIEVLIDLGRLDEARSLLERLEERGRRLDRAWALATAARCRGLLFGARGELAEALAALEQALVEHERLPEPFELARTLLALGQTQRRAKRRRAARDTLMASLAVFERLGARIWAETARAELARISGRAPSAGELTPTEARVAELVAAGASNKEAATQLHVSVHTIEANLTRIYAKLSVHSRRELIQTRGRRVSEP